MPDILLEVTIAATPDRVFRAITEQQQLAAWWTTHVVAEPVIGSTLQASFWEDTRRHEIEVIGLEPARKIEWIPRQSFFPDWLDTRITWELSPVENSTKLWFSQRGFPSEEGSLRKVSYGWVIYISSLKAYLETGTGNPHRD